MDRGLAVWTVYDHPRDYPRCYVARKYVVVEDDGRPKAVARKYVPASSWLVLAPTLEAMHHQLEGWGLTRLERPSVDPKVLETWV